MTVWWLYVLVFFLFLIVIGVINQQMYRRHEQKLAQITGEHPRDWDQQ